MRIVSNNFYSIEDNLRLIVSLQTGSTPVPVGDTITFFLDRISTGSELTVTTNSQTFNYEIVDDENELQQIYNLKMQPGGLISSISTYTNYNAVIRQPDITHLSFTTSNTFKDYDFWFSRQELRLLIPNEETVDEIEVMYSNFKQPPPLELTALQSTNELVILTEPTPVLNLEQSAEVQFKVFTNENEYITDILSIVPGDITLSECRVSGTLFEGDSTINQREIFNKHTSIILTLRFETWIEDIDLIRSELPNFIKTTVFYAASSIHFESERPSPVNDIGFNTLLSEANVARTSEQIVTISLGRNIDIVHPETITIQNIPSTLIRSNEPNLPVVTPYDKTIHPPPGILQVLTPNGNDISEQELWTQPTRIILRALQDAWQDPLLLNTPSLEAFKSHIRNSMTSDSPEWTTFMKQVEFDMTSSGSDLYVDLAPQSSSVFNIPSVIEVTVDIGLITPFGLCTRFSNTPFENTTFFLIKPVQSFVSISKSLVTEHDIWNSEVAIIFSLVDDVFIVGSDVILSFLTANFDSVFPLNTISSSFFISKFQEDSFTLIIPKGSPNTFNINSDQKIFFQFPSSCFRNGNDLSSPEISFLSTQVLSTIENTTNITKQNLMQGFQFTIRLLNDSWTDSDEAPITSLSRSDEPNGWNRLAHLTFTFTQSTLIVTVLPTPTYAVSSIEVIDIFINKKSTYNQKREYAGNFTIQGSTLLERDFHDYNHNLQDLTVDLNDIKRKIHAIKLTLATKVRIKDTKDSNGSFNTADTLDERLRKINSSALDHPISLCRPPLVNGVESTFVQATVNSLLNALRHYTAPREFKHFLCVPVLCPDFQTATEGSTLFSVLLSRPLPLVVQINDEVISFSTPRHVHTFCLGPLDDLSLSGDGIQTLVFKR